MSVVLERVHTEISEVRRGDVWLADLSPTVGSEQGGVRPVLIISNDKGNKYGTTVIVAIITAQVQKAKLPTHVVVDAKSYGLERDSIIMLEQIRTVDKQRLSHKVSSLNSVIMQQVKKAQEISCADFF